MAAKIFSVSVGLCNVISVGGLSLSHSLCLVKSWWSS